MKGVRMATRPRLLSLSMLRCTQRPTRTREAQPACRRTAASGNDMFAIFYASTLFDLEKHAYVQTAVDGVFRFMAGGANITATHSSCSGLLEVHYRPVWDNV